MPPAQGVLPPIVVVPLASLAVLVIAAHLTALHGDRSVPLSRKRLRTANGVVMLVTAVVLVYAFAWAPPSDAARFALAWAASVMLLTAVLALSALDIINNLRLARLHRRRMQRTACDLGAQLSEFLRNAREDAARRRNAESDQPPRP